jgi:hypothetical protein
MLPFIQSANEIAHGDWRGGLESAAIGIVAGKVANAASERLGSALVAVQLG